MGDTRMPRVQSACWLYRGTGYESYSLVLSLSAELVGACRSWQLPLNADRALCEGAAGAPCCTMLHHLILTVCT